MATFSRAIAVARRIAAREHRRVRVYAVRQRCTCPPTLRGGHAPSAADPGVVYEYVLQHSDRLWAADRTTS